MLKSILEMAMAILRVEFKDPDGCQEWAAAVAGGNQELEDELILRFFQFAEYGMAELDLNVDGEAFSARLIPRSEW